MAEPLKCTAEVALAGARRPDGSSVAGIEAVLTNSQREFEQFFKTPTCHKVTHVGEAVTKPAPQECAAAHRQQRSAARGCDVSGE